VFILQDWLARCCPYLHAQGTGRSVG